VNVDELTEALTAHDADPEATLAALKTKRRRSTRNRAALLGGSAVVLAVVVVVGLLPWFRSQPGLTSGDGTADGCAGPTLPDEFARARQEGDSIVLANGTLTGRTVMPAGMSLYYQMELKSVRTLSGPPISDDTTGWLDSTRGPAGPEPGADQGPLWGVDGQLLAIVDPPSEPGFTSGRVIRVTPVVGDQVLFSGAGCWVLSGVDPHPYSGPLSELPGSDSRTDANRYGFQSVPLTTVEQTVRAIS
jgi:hypothetical protein